MKKWLENNKIYMDVVSSILIGAAAVMVAYASYTVSEQQLLLAEVSLQPHFHVETSYTYDQKKEKYSESDLYVFNSGAPINNAEFSVKSFLVIDHEFKGERVVTHLPIIGYYPAQFTHQTPSGKLVTFKGHLNNENFFRLYREFLDEKNKKKFGFVDINLEHIVIVSYQDRKGMPGKAHFIDSELVSIDAVSEKLEKHRAMLPTEIEGLSADRLMVKVSDYESGITRPSSGRSR
ncbi:MAG: hypothetical protein KUF74_18365 [Candidatus Thiodiazotropha sp. (ex Ctena orbiculata)]|nr:hypothetical protein [Candidatus Thiodiazotropha taylori]